MASATTIVRRASGTDGLHMTLPSCDKGRLIVRAMPNASDWDGWFQASVQQYALDGVYNPGAATSILDQSFGSAHGANSVSTSLELVVDLDDLLWPNNELSVTWEADWTNSDPQEAPATMQINAWFIWLP